uniref:Uncharacterized protein n=1 Tax=Amphimedon queenslandica TaxID=400682 RepID=A0A1X7TH60_AMPQE
MGKLKKQKKSSSKRKKFQRSNETLSNTTVNKLKQNRTNPHANVKLSGKKRKKLIRDARRKQTEQQKQEEMMELAMAEVQQ